MAGKVLAASGRQYPEAWSRRLSLPFAPALAYGDKRDAFDESVAEFCAGLKWKAKIAAESGDWREAVDFACSGTLSLVNFQGGIVAASQALASWSPGADCFAPSYFLFLALKTIAKFCPGGMDDLVACIPEGLESHPAVRTALALWALQAGDDDGFQRERNRIAASYLHSNVEHLDIMRIEKHFAHGCAEGPPSWYYAMCGYYCRRPFERMLWLNDTYRVNPTLCYNIRVPFHLQTAAESFSRSAATWHSASAMEFRRSIVDGDFTYCRRSVCPEILLKRLPKEADPKLQTIKIFKDTGQIPSAPKEIILALDWTCNLACPACRKEHYRPKAGEIKKLLTCYEREIKPLLRGGDLTLNMDGSGEALASKLGRRALRDFRAVGNPRNKLLLSTNAQLLTEKIWNTELAGLNVTCAVSIDAASQKTYEALRWPGKWDILCRNMSHLAEQLRAGNLKKLRTSFIVQKSNWREMLEFAALCKTWGVSECSYHHLHNKAGYAIEEHMEHDVFNPAHPCFAEATSLLNETRLYCENNGIIFSTSGALNK